MSNIYKISELNPKGYGVGTAETDEKKVQIWNSLPGELVEVEFIKRKKVANAVNILQKSEWRQEPKDEHFISTAPWQILDIGEENRIKSQFIADLFGLEKLEIYSDNIEYNYRNKVEYGFYGIDGSEEIRLAVFRRGTHGKIPVSNNHLLPEIINQTAEKIVNYLNKLRQKTGLTARNLKTVIIRSSIYENKTVACLFVKDEGLDFEGIENLVGGELKGIGLVYSNPKSPASVVTKEIATFGELELMEKVGDTILKYDIHQFFQVNIPVFQAVITDLQTVCGKMENLIDLYSGVGTLGICLMPESLISVESSQNSQKYARENAEINQIKNYQIWENQAEKDTNWQTKADTLVVDPPRSGLHPDVAQQICKMEIKTLVYLSCNPETQARDWEILKNYFDLQFIKAYNFYPHTPHCENLIVATRKENLI
jgi:23S rRNA (uracil1939-C5)-methyltransferase